ncbi:MAG: mono/diheme cytochrome c family protein [Planctomycetaceae bacterium]|jgi:mono/diheme cytochrome c family protein
MGQRPATFQCVITLAFAVSVTAKAVEPADQTATTIIENVIQHSCSECHNAETSEGKLNLTALTLEPKNSDVRSRWIHIHDRVRDREMPPDADSLAPTERAAFLKHLSNAIHEADLAEVAEQGRGPIRRLNRDEYQQNLRDVLSLPNLDIRDMLPEDRESHHFNKTTETLDISRVQLIAYLDAAEAALCQAMASGIQPPPKTEYRAVGAKLFPGKSTFGNRQAMFFTKDSKGIDNKQLDEAPDDPNVEMALFRSAHWPYYGYPQGFFARLPGEYRVRFSARAILQQPGFLLTPATQPLPMTFRARKPSGPDVSGDVRATGGLIDVKPEQATYETTIRLRERETFEYSPLGLPVPLARNVNNGPPTYRYPPFPAGGQPGVAFQWLEVEGPLSLETWPPPSHRVLFDELPIRAASGDDGLPVEVVSENPSNDARRLFRRFINLAARQPVPDEAILKYEQLILSRLAGNDSFAAAMLAGYKAFLCSGHMIYVQEPKQADDHFAIASRLSHFLTNSRPDLQLMALAGQQQLRNADTLRTETDRLINGDAFDSFITHFTDYWLELRNIHRDEPDIRRFPEYRFDAYLVESMARETRAFFAAMVRENLPASALVKTDFIFANDRLAKHYQLSPLTGSTMRKVTLPGDSPYGGLLTQAAVLKITSNGTATSPVIRGAWIMDRLIGQPPPKPPASVPAVEPDIRGAKTIRELLALHAAADSCAGCHARFDPVGVALENFDIFGSWRSRYRGLASLETNEKNADAENVDKIAGIDRAGHDFAYTLTGNVDASGQLLDGRIFRDINELKEILVSNDRQLARNLLHQFTVYSTGTPVRFSDRSEIEVMLDACSGNGYRVRDLLHALVQSRIFLGLSGCE